MTKEDIIKMAQEAGAKDYGTGEESVTALMLRDDAIERFFHMAQAAEREACAKVVDENAAGCLGLLKHVLRENANAIRSRGNDD